MSKHEILYPDTDYTNLILRWGKNKSLEVFSKDSSGDVEICLNDYNENTSMYLDQKGIKLLIEHLQKQINI
jgi:hypothetical protein